MPTHVTNLISFGTDEAALSDFRKMLELVRADGGYLGSVDFNKVIPMPKNIYQGDLGRREIEKYGKNNWYDWSCDHWGTKWNAYGCIRADKNADTLRFCTAWSAVPKIVKLISERFPDRQLIYQWADENTGYNVGKEIWKNGAVQESLIPPKGSKEAYQMAKKIYSTAKSLEKKPKNKDRSR